MLNFTALAKPVRVVVPILNRSFTYNKKLYKIGVDDGWWQVELQGNKATAIETHLWTDPPRNALRGVSYGTRVVFSHFEVARRKYSLDVIAPLEFPNVETFASIFVMVWEDNRTYYVMPCYADFKTVYIKDLLDDNLTLENVKEITPELRTVFLFHALERIEIRKKLEELEKIKHEEEMKQTVEGRLRFAFDRSGATITEYHVGNGRIEVTWSVPGAGSFNSVLDDKTFMVLEAGYCMSGDDRRHNVTSMVKTAEDYHARRLVHRTRGRTFDRTLDPHEERDYDYDD